MKDRITKKLTTIIMITIGILIIISSIFIVLSKSQNIYNYTKENKNYSIKISYEKTKIKDIDTKIKEIVAKEKQEFIKETKNINENSETKYNLIIKGEVKEYNDIEFTHIIVNKLTGGNHYKRKDISYVYNKNSQNFTNASELLKNKNSFKELSLISKHLINKYAEDHKIKLVEKDLINGTNPKKENYQNIYLSKKGLTIIFVPYQVSSRFDGEIKVTIPWNKLNDILKEEYKNKKIINDTITIEKRDISKYKNQKVIAFTFDDGPNTATTKILLDNLDKYDAKVTFFVLGSRVNDNKKILKRAYKEGNDIASHTYSHKDLTTLKDKELEKEINRTNTRIKHIIGVEPIYLRPPYGSVNEHVKNQTIMHTICWNIDSLDWKTKNRKKIKKEIVKNARDGGVVLVHDIYKESVYGALLAMKDLKKKGYSFVTITEMAELKNVTLDYDKTYYGF